MDAAIMKEVSTDEEAEHSEARGQISALRSIAAITGFDRRYADDGAPRPLPEVAAEVFAASSLILTNLTNPSVWVLSILMYPSRMAQYRKALRFLVSGALLIGPTMGCEDEEQLNINEPEPEAVRTTNNEPVPHPLPIDPVNNEFLDEAPVEEPRDEEEAQAVDDGADIGDALGDVRANEVPEPTR